MDNIYVLSFLVFGMAFILFGMLIQLRQTLVERNPDLTIDPGSVRIKRAAFIIGLAILLFAGFLSLL